MLLRRATAADQGAINHIVRSARINPLGLTWARFIVAEEAGVVIGTGQVKPHRDGSRELASIAVVPSQQGRGVARAIIERLINDEAAAGNATLYLTCRSHLEGFYTRFGFRSIGPQQAPPHFRRILRMMGLASWLAGLLGRREGGRVMRREVPRARSK